MRGLVVLFVILNGSAALAQDKVFDMRPVKAPNASGLTDQGFDAWVGQTNDIFKTAGCARVSAKRVAGYVTDRKVRDPALTSSDKASLSSVTSGNVIVISDLRWCGQEYPTSVAGCEGSGPIILVANTKAGFTLIHEVGHRVGLHHTYRGAGCPVPAPAGVSDADFRNIMYCRRHDNRRLITAAQCNAFSNSASVPLMLAVSPNLLAETAEPVVTTSAGDAEWVRQFLESGFDDGTPFDAIEALSAEQIDQIRAILADETQLELWSNAAIVLGLKGDAGDVERLSGLLQRVAGRTEPESQRARTSAAFGLGFLANRIGGGASDQALSLLVENSAAPNASRISGPEGGDALARSFIKAVAYSGNLVASKAVIDVAAASGKLDISAGEAPQITEYVQKNELRGNADTQRFADLPEIDSPFAQNVADTALGVKERGLMVFLRAPQSQPDAIFRMNSAVGAESELGKAASEAVRSLGVEAVPLWNSQQLERLIPEKK